MSSIMKVFLLLAVMFCISQAQHNETGQQCLCRRVRNAVGSKDEIKDIQIYPATIFCDKVEIVVTNNNGYRYCLNPRMKAMKNVLVNIIGRQRTSTPRPADFSSTPGSSSTARI
ncbi:C-X-C motif chemokine 10-like [Chelmon rostratus]|uniref:C-X-C motif chemokine 10-like n=1 Tax=Chelmon rostratus TaxID=109905 RepID=UPI001BEA35DA|nr:C-X-C motif chemokine 10-like [Chelmon rostratus]